MRKLILTCLPLFLATHLLAQIHTVESIPNPKEGSVSSYVSNPDNILSENIVIQINQRLRELEEKNSTQVAVVALNSIGDEPIFDFSQKLFEHWGIGQKGKDNGLLILLVTEKRTVRFHAGFGLEEVLPDVVCKHIQKQYMVPHFESGSYDKGMMEGVETVTKILSSSDFADDMKSETRAENRKAISVVTSVALVILMIIFYLKRLNGSFSKTSSIRAERRLPYVKKEARSWVLWFLAGPTAVGIVSWYLIDISILFIGLYALIALSLFYIWQQLLKEIDKWNQKKEYKIIYDFLLQERWKWNFTAFIFPIPGLAFIYLFNKKIRFQRNHPRQCQKCGNSAIKLDEETEDAYLTKEQIFEENLKVNDYDVWKCSHCESTEIILYENESSNFKTCPKCKTKAYRLEKVTTPKQATRFSPGVKEEDYHCTFCGVNIVNQVALVYASSDSDSGSDGSSSSSDSGSFGGE